MTTTKSSPTLEAWDSLATALLIVNGRGVVFWANRAAEGLIGRPRKGLIDLSVGEVLPEASSWFVGREGSERSSLAEVSLERYLPGGVRSPLRSRVTLVPLASSMIETVEGCDPSLEYLLIEIIPIEDTLQLERDEMGAKLLEANREILRNLAHEIKNPLGGIRGAAQLLEAVLSDPADKECTQIIIEEVGRLQSLVDRFLAPYRTPKNDELVNVHELLEHVKSLVKLEYGDKVRLDRDYDISAPAIQADKSRLTQVFLNLVQNAAQALLESDYPLEGPKTILMKTRLVRDALVGNNRVRQALAVDIVDNGPGIKAEIKDKIFYPLVTGRADGTGLGLSLVQTFVHQAGGTLSVDSHPGHTCFKVILPLPERKKRTE